MPEWKRHSYMGNRQRLSVLIATIGVAAIGPVAHSARADCIGPTIEYTSGTFSRGDVFTVIGTGWGNNCYDTGPPPEGQGVLGVPVSDITVSIVQDDGASVVASGSASLDYGFTVSFVLPDELEPGPALVVASADVPFVYDATDQPLEITEAVAPPTADTVATFGPAPVSPTAPSVEVTAETQLNPRTSAAARAPSTVPPPTGVARSSVDPAAGSTNEDDNSAFILVAIVLAAGAMAGVVVLLRRRR